jgi:hypothetical protein
MTGKVPIGAKVSHDTAQKVQEKADELGSNKSDVLRRAVVDYFEDEPASTTSPLALLALIVAGVATLLATGYTVEGLAFAALGALYLPVWVFGWDARVEAWARETREGLREAGAFGVIRNALNEDRVVENPTSPVERLTRADLAGGVSFGVLLVIGAGVGLLEATNLLAPTLETLGAGGGVALLAIVVALMYLVWVSFAVSALATIVVARRHAGDASGGETQAAADRGGA